MQIVVLAGGLAARVASESEQIPQSLSHVRARPLIDWQLDRFSASGARSIVLCVGYLGEQIETHVKRALDRGLAVSYSYDGAEQVGTGGALRRAFARLENEFVLTYGDRYLPFDYAAPLHDLRAHPDALGTMSVYRNRSRVGASSVVLDGDHVAKYEAGATATELDFADYGATVVKVESTTKVDTLRTIAPFKDNTPGPERSAAYATVNAGKLGLTLNLMHEKGRDIALKLAAWADARAASSDTFCRLTMIGRTSRSNRAANSPARRAARATDTRAAT